jgi:hypothetical protein
MASCKDVAAFLGGVNSRSVADGLSDADLATLQQLGLISVLTGDQLAAARQSVAGLSAAQASVAQETALSQQEAADLARRSEQTHSFVFRLEGAERQQAEEQAITEEGEALKSTNAELAKRQAEFSALLAQQAVVESAVPLGDRYVALTGTGRLAMRDLAARMYRVSDTEFSAYWAEAEEVDGELTDVATRSATYVGSLAGALPSVDRSYLWAVAIGIAKAGGDPNQRIAAYLAAYSAMAPLAGNVENQLMASEIVSSLPPPPGLELLPSLNQQVRQMGIPPASSLGVAAILLSGRRADGSIPLPQLAQFRARTPSFESAALLAIINRPFDEVAGRFDTFRQLFAGWGYATSEDTELSAAYLAVSDVPAETVAPKLSIIARGMSAYLRYPLVGASILASVPVLEANETLSLVEKAYEILGTRTGPMAPAELICLAIRIVHGIHVKSVDELDSTAAPTAAGAGTGYGSGYFYPRVWVPIFIVHGMYYSTYSGIGGMHPAHVHAFGGAGGGGGGGVSSG